MELSILLLKKIITLLLMVMMGFFSVRSGKLKSEQSTVLSRVCFDWVVPCSLINSFLTTYNSEVMESFLITCGAAMVLIVFYILLTRAVGRFVRLNPSESGSLMFTNSASMALPLASALLGTDSVIYCAPHMAIQNFFLFTLVPWMMHGKADGGWKKVLLNRNIISIMIGLIIFVTQIPLPSVITDTITTVGGSIGVFNMFLIGMLMGGVNFRELFRERKLYLIALLRLIIYPFLAILIVRISGVNVRFPFMNNAIMVLIMCVSSPVATLITQMSDLYRPLEEAQESGSINVMTTILCSITMPVMIFVYQIVCL